MVTSKLYYVKEKEVKKMKIQTQNKYLLEEKLERINRMVEYGLKTAEGPRSPYYKLGALEQVLRSIREEL